MGASQSLDTFFGSSNHLNDSEQANVYQYLRRVEKTLWLTGPWWEHDNDVLEFEAGNAKEHSPTKRSAKPRDPLKKMTPNEALSAIPAMLDEMWVSPLVALVDCVDPIARSAGIALLSRIVQRDSVAKIFIGVKGMDKMITLLDSHDQQSTYLALEVIFALCAGSPSVILPFCEAGLIGRLTELIKGENLELVLASLKVLRLTLRQNAVKAELPTCKTLSILMDLVHSPHAAVAKTAITCIGLSLPNADNLAELLRLGCIDIFLRFMMPTNSNADAAIFALSLIADETDTIFPREQTTGTLGRMLETLRGAAKRSAAASATSFLFASLAKSSIFHTAICSETNLGILAKLLVGGSLEVLASTAYALGIVALHANDRVRQILFQVDAPQNLMQLVILSLGSSGPGRDEKVARLAIFALATVTNEALVSRTGTLVQPELFSPSSGALESLRISTTASCEGMQGVDFLPHVYARAITRLGAGSTYALKLLAALSTAPHVKDHMCEAETVTRMLEYLRGASAAFLPTLLVLFLECCSCDHECACKEIGSSESVPGSSLTFSKLVETTPDALQILGALFQNHQPENLVGLAPLLGALAAHSNLLSERMSSTTFFVDQVLSIATRLNHEALHEQVLGFLVGLTASKNTRALEQLFASDPDRIANLLQASLNTQVQLLAATVLRRLFKRLNSIDIPSRPAQRHLAKLLATSSVVSVSVCRVWGNLFQFEDKRLAFAQIPDSVSGLLLLLQRCIGSQPIIDGKLTALIQASGDTQSLESEEKKAVPQSLKPLYWVIRSTFRTACCEITKQSLVVAPQFLCIMDLFPHRCDPIARLAIDTMSELARSKTPGLRRTLAVPVVLNAIQQLLRDHERVTSGHGVLPQRHVLRFLGLLARKDAAIQHLVVESRLLEALLLLLGLPSTSLNSELLAEALDALAWVCSAARSPTNVEAQAEIDDETEIETPVEGEAPARRVVATPKMVDFSLRHVDSALAPVACASLHLLQRLACEQTGVPLFVHEANGATVIMRALQQRSEYALQRRACGLVRHLVHRHDGNRQQFQELGATSFLVELVTRSQTDLEAIEEQRSSRKLQIKGLQALAALCKGSGSAARASKKELLECDQSAELVRLVGVDDINDDRFCAAWTRTLAMGAFASSTNQRRLVSVGIVPLLTKLLRHSSGHVRVSTAQLLAYLAEAPENRGVILNEGGESLLGAVIAGLESELPGLQRYTALFVANAATRHEGNKVRLGAAGAAAPLVDRLSSQRRHVLENVLLAVVKLGSHAGNKVKLGGKVCFEKLLSLVHHETLGVAKGAARVLAVLIVGNDANKKFLLQCEAPVIAELSALLKGSNGTIVESAVLVLGELAPMPTQALELSRCVDVLSVVKLIAHINPRIARAALLVVRHLTRESFNKTRFGLRECVEALLACLRLGLGGTSGADELEMVELTITCLANLSFASTNASRIAEAKDQHGGSLLLLLQLTTSALSISVHEYLSEKEVSRLMFQGEAMNAPSSTSSSKAQQGDDFSVDTGNNEQELDDAEMYESMARNSPKKSVDGRGSSPRREKSDEPRQAEVEFQPQTLDFSAFPSLQTAVLEQTLLVLSNCADQYRTAKVVDILAVAVLCQVLRDSSELVARCGCYTLACWLKQNTSLQDAATRRGALPALSKLLTSTSLVVVEAAAYVTSKLAARGDNPMKLLALDVPATLVHGILRKPTNVPHDRVLDHAVRLLGTLVQFSRVRQALKGEEIIADVLTPLLQLHPQNLGKNLSRLVLALLADDSLKFFLPKKTVSLLRACFAHEATSAKTIRNVLRIFALLVTVEEHKTTITLEDSGEALGRMVQELRIDKGVLGENDETVLGLLACVAGTKKIAVILHENDLYMKLPPYILVPEEGENLSLPGTENAVAAEKSLQKRRLHTVQIAARLCKALGEQAVRRLSELEFTSLLLELLRVGLPSSPLPEVQAENEALQATASSINLSPLTWECVDVLRQLCSYPHDERIIGEEGGIEVFLSYFEFWLAVTSGTAPYAFPAEGGEKLVLAFAVSLAATTRMLSGQTPNREILAQCGGFPLVLKALGLGTPELPNPQREQLAEALTSLTALPIMVPYFETSPDLVTPLFRFMIAPQTQQLAHLLLLALRAFADVMEVSPASRSYVLKITGGTIQPLPFLLSCLDCSNISASDDSILRLLHTMRSLQRLVTDETTAGVLAPLDNVPAIGKLLSLEQPTRSTSDRLELVQLMVTETLGYMAYFGHAPRLRLERSAVARLLSQADYANDERVKPENVATSIWTLALLAAPQIHSNVESEEDEVRAGVETTANCVRSWMWKDSRGLDVLIRCGLRAPEYLNLPTSVVSDVLAVLTKATENDPEAETVLTQLVQKRVCTPVAFLLEAVEPVVRRPALKLLARMLSKQTWASNEPVVSTTASKKKSMVDSSDDEIPGERWSAILLLLAEWMQIYAQDPQTTPLNELRDAYSCLSVLTAHNELAAQIQQGQAPRGLINLVAATMQHFGGKKLPSRPESLVLIRKESACSEITTLEATAQDITAERTRLSWVQQFETVLHVLRVCRRMMTFSSNLSEHALELHVPRALDSLVLLHDRRILDEALRCMLHLTTLHGEDTVLIFSSDRTVARLKGLLQSESRPLQARITPILSLMAANMPTLPGLCGMDGILILADLAVSSAVGNILAKTDDAALNLDHRVFQDSCTMLNMIFSHEEGVVLAYDVAQVIPKLFGIVEKMTATCIASSENDAPEAPELLHMPLGVLVKVSVVPAVHVRYLELLPQICRLLDGENGPARLTGRWCEMLLSILFNVFGCPFESVAAVCEVSVETLAQGKRALLPQLLPLERWLSVIDTFPALGRFVIELIRAFVGNGELSSPYAALFNSGEDIPALLKLVGSPSDEVAIPSAQLLLAVLKQRDVRVALIVADGVPALVVALCQAKSINVQNLLLALLLDLSKGDTEVQALLLVAPGCVTRLVEFVQECVDAHATNDKKGVCKSLDKRLALTCTLLAELSCALHGPERIVEANGHLSLLALSIQQQKNNDVQSAQTTVQILANLAVAGMSVAPELATSKLPAHFLSCVLSDEKDAKLSKNALPLKRRLALTGLVALAKANRELRTTLAQSGPLVVLLESLLQKPEKANVKREEDSSTLSQDALLLLCLLSTTGCVHLVRHSSPEILTRICGIINQHLILHKEGEGLKDEQATPVEVTRGLKLLANLLDVAHDHETKFPWHPEHLLDLSSLLEARVAAHQTPKQQLPALRVLRGAFALATTDDPTKSFYYPLSPKLLAELLTVLLVSPSRQHHDIAERIVVSAFQNDPERARESVGDNQILEQLLIVFTLPGAQRVSELAVILTQVLYVSITRGFVVSQRFLAKIPALLASYADEALLAENDDINQPLKRALSIYLSFVHSSCPPTLAMRSGISDMLRSEGDSRRALIVLLHQLLLVHRTFCLKTHSQVTLTSEDVMLWTCIVESVSPLTPALAAVFTTQASPATWMCILRDWFNWVEAIEKPEDEGLRNSCRMLSVVAHLTTSEKETEELLVEQRSHLCSRCLAVLSRGGDVLSPRVIEGALQALMDVREAWGDTFVLIGCSTFNGTTALLPKLLNVFHVPEREANRSRHLVLQFLLLLAGTGYFIEEIKAAGARSAVENNPLISPDDKALPVALLGMLGYSADLNEEFARALEQFDAANSEGERRERVAYLLRFLERYALTHAPTKVQAIDSFMAYLVADAEKAQAAALTTKHEPEVTKDEQSSASKLAFTIASDCLASLGKIAGWSPTQDRSPSTGFGELYLSRWDLNALLSVAFARQRGDENNDFQEIPRLAVTQIAQVLELAALVRAYLDENARTGGTGVVVVGHIDERWLCNAFTLVSGHFSSPNANAQSGSTDLQLIEHILELLHWLAVNSSNCFEDICRYGVLLRSLLAPLTPIFCGHVNNDIGHGAMELFLSLVEMTVNTPMPGTETTASIDELLGDLLKFLYAQVDNGLLQGVRARLLLCVLVILQRTGDAGRAACVAYERAMQQILWHIHASPTTELQARCSWELLGLLSELDPAITALFNLDAIPVLLRECGCDPSEQQPRPSSGGWRHSKRAVAFRQAESLKCLSRAARTHDEVLLKIGMAPGIAAVLFDALAIGPVGNAETGGRRKSIPKGTPPVDSAGTQAHAAHLIARIAAQEDLRASLVSPENISLLIESLESVHLPVVLHALQALAHLCAFSLCLDALVRNATVPVLAQILFSPLVATARRREIEACVLDLLGKMCNRSQIVSRRIVSSNLLPKLCEFLVVEKQELEYTQQEPQSGEFGVHDKAVWIVYSLSKDAELVPKLVAHGIFEALSDQLLEYVLNATQRKALGAMSRLANVANVDAEFLQSLISQVVESVRRNVPVPEAHRSVTNALEVFVAILKAGKNRHNLIQQRQQRRPQSQQQQRQHREDGDEVNIRQLLLKGEGLRVALDLLGASDLRAKLEAFRVVSEFVENHPDSDEVRELLLGSEEQGGSHALLSLVRALSDEARSATTAMASALPSARSRGKDDLLLVVMTFLNMLLADDVLKAKLTPTTYDVVLQVVVAISATPTNNMRVLAESLKALSTMTRAGQVTDFCPEAALVSSVEPLVKVLQSLSTAESGSSSTSIRLNTLFLLVNFASSAQCRGRMAHCGALEALLEIIQSPGCGSAAQDDQLVQLALLGVALMTTGGVSDAAAVVELSTAVDTLVRLLSSKSASIQANAVWVVSNISSEASLKEAIVLRGGPTALQTMLNENLSDDTTSNGGATQYQRPSTSTMRICEYAPKAIKALGFAPIMPPGASST